MSLPDYVMVGLSLCVAFVLGWIGGWDRANRLRDEEERRGMTQEMWLQQKVREGDEARRQLGMK